MMLLHLAFTALYVVAGLILYNLALWFFATLEEISKDENDDDNIPRLGF